MTKQEVLNAMNCMNCYQDDEMCMTKRDYLFRPSCQSCMGHDKAMQIINDFVDDMADRLDAITWHPYPEEKPTAYGFYLVTCRDNDVLECRWDSDQFEILDAIAWKELPKPYGENE